MARLITLKASAPYQGEPTFSFFFQAEDGIRDFHVTGVQTCALPIFYEKNRGNLAEALEMSRKGGRDQKDERFAYLAASIHALENRWDEAAQTLARAVELNPKNRIHA